MAIDLEKYRIKDATAVPPTMDVSASDVPTEKAPVDVSKYRTATPSGTGIYSRAATQPPPEKDGWWMKAGNFATDILAGGAKKLGKTLGTAVAGATGAGKTINKADVDISESNRKLAELLKRPDITEEQKTHIHSLMEDKGSGTATEVLPDLNTTTKQVIGQGMMAGMEALSGGAIGGNAAKAKNVLQALSRGATTGALYGLLSGTSQGLQDDKDAAGIAKSAAAGTAGGALMGGAIGAAGYEISKIPEKLSKKSEEIYRKVLKMTPTELTNEKAKGKNTPALIRDMGLSGHVEEMSDELRAVYHSKEGELSGLINDKANQGVTVSADEFEKGVNSALEKYKTHVSEYTAIKDKMTSIISNTKELFGDAIPVNTANEIKRALWADSFNKNGTDVTNEAVYEAGSMMKTLIEKSIPDGDIASKNAELGKFIVASRQLAKSENRKQTSFIARWAGRVLGGALGGSMGGVAGAAGGAITGGHLEDLLMSPTLRTNVAKLMEKSSKSLPSEMPAVANELKDVLVRHILMNAGSSAGRSVNKNSDNQGNKNASE